MMEFENFVKIETVRFIFENTWIDFERRKLKTIIQCLFRTRLKSSLEKSVSSVKVRRTEGDESSAKRRCVKGSSLIALENMTLKTSLCETPFSTVRRELVVFCYSPIKFYCWEKFAIWKKNYLVCPSSENLIRDVMSLDPGKGLLKVKKWQ